MASWWRERLRRMTGVAPRCVSCQLAAERAERAAQRAVAAAVAASEAAAVVTGHRGAGDGAWRGLDDDLETLDPRR